MTHVRVYLFTQIIQQHHQLFKKKRRWCQLIVTPF
nr:MAG TPA: hypothetical protein [Caudoviricetes sp.]